MIKLFRHFCITGIILASTLFVISGSTFCATGNIQEQILPDIGKTIPRQAGVTDVRETVFYYRAQNDLLTYLDTTVSYGFTDRIGIRFNLPIILLYQKLGNHSQGSGDLRVELSANIYMVETFLLNVMGGMSFPVGNVKKVPNIGTGAYGFTGQFTVVHNSHEWYMGERVAWHVTSTKHHFKNGNEFNLELGFGKRMHFDESSPSSFYYIVQLVTLLNEQDRLLKKKLPNTGQAVIFFGPLLSWARSNFLMEGSFQVPIAQNRFGIQPQFDFRTALTVEIKF